MKVKSIGKDKHGMPTINNRKIVTFRKLKEEKELLLMGGAYGHMAHPFDDYALTFGELKDIIDLGLQGKLDKEEAVTEMEPSDSVQEIKNIGQIKKSDFL